MKVIVIEVNEEYFRIEAENHEKLLRFLFYIKVPFNVSSLPKREALMDGT